MRNSHEHENSKTVKQSEVYRSFWTKEKGVCVGGVGGLEFKSGTRQVTGR